MLKKALLCAACFLLPSAYAASTVTAIYDTVQQKVVMIVVDAANLKDPAYNPPNCVQVPFDAVTYNSFTDSDTAAAAIESYVDQKMQGAGQ